MGIIPARKRPPLRRTYRGEKRFGSQAMELLPEMVKARAGINPAPTDQKEEIELALMRNFPPLF